jgi:hypothetical protein
MNSNTYTQKIIPDILFDFLYDLIDSDSAIREVKLVSNILEFMEVQDIIFKTMNGSIFHRVFGFSPVNAHLKISNFGGKHVLIEKKKKRKAYE